MMSPKYSSSVDSGNDNLSRFIRSIFTLEILIDSIQYK